MVFITQASTSACDVGGKVREREKREKYRQTEREKNEREGDRENKKQ